MSDLPVWIGASGSVVQGVSAAVQLFLGVRAVREEAAAEFGRLLDDLLDMPAEEIAELLGKPRLAEIVGYGWEAAARSASAEKRWMLAKVVTAALRDPDDADVDPIPLLLRTVEAIDEPHVRLLVLVATPRPGTGSLTGTPQEGYVRIEDLTAEWPGAADLIQPLLSVLEREGLVEDRGVGTWGYQPTFGVTGYGRQLLQFLPGEPLAELRRSRLTLYPMASARVRVRNVGLGRARSISFSDPPISDGSSLFRSGSVPAPFDLDPGEDLELDLVEPTLARPHPFRIDATWNDDEGDRAERFTVEPTRA